MVLKEVHTCPAQSTITDMISLPEEYLLDCHNRKVPIPYRLTGSTGGVGDIEGQLTKAVIYPSVAHGHVCAITIAMIIR
jgi:hypothetical protein